MNTPDEHTAPPPPSPARRSRLMLLLFASFILLTAAGFVTTGFLLRDSLRERGGPLHVTVENRHDEKVRVDFFLSGHFAVVELDPGQGGLLRFNPPEVTPLEIRVFRRNNPTASLVEEDFHPGREESVTVIVNSPGSVRISRELRGTPTQGLHAGAATP